ncbi:hypothetical protein WJX77_005008 [Trebouxia sp. C0004]
MIQDGGAGGTCQQRRQVRTACAIVTAQAGQKYDYDLVIIGAGVGGHGAAMHAIESDIKFNVHAHPTLSEVLDELFKQAHLEKVDRPDAKPAAAQKMPQEARV